MNPGTTVSTGTTPPARRADAGTVRLGERDVAGLLLCGDMYGAPYDLLAAFLAVRADRTRGIVARWRNAGYAATGRLGPGPAWCWLTRAGIAVTGLGYTSARPALGRLAHIRAVLAVRLSLQASAAYQDGRGWWRSTGSVPVMTFWAYLRFRILLWALRMTGRFLRVVILAAVLAAAAPVTLVTAMGFAGAWLRVTRDHGIGLGLVALAVLKRGLVVLAGPLAIASRV